MRAVLDTNVLVSGLLSADGACGHIVFLMFGGAMQPCVDDRILHEYEAVLPRPLFRISPQDVQETLQMIRLRAERVAAPPLAVQLPHPADAPFLEVAVAADVPLVTGNHRHFPASARAGAAVLSPREFLERMPRTA